MRKTVDSTIEEFGLTVCTVIRDDDTPMHNCVFNATNHYVGQLEEVRAMWEEHGVRPEAIDEASTCSIGFSEMEQRWYAWSHRGIVSFGVGDSVNTQAHICRVSGWLPGCEPEGCVDTTLPLGFEAKTLEDAKLMAVSAAAALD